MFSDLVPVQSYDIASRCRLNQRKGASNYVLEGFGGYDVDVVPRVNGVVSKGVLVVEVGEGLPTVDGDKVVACKVKKGDKVLFQQYAGSEVTVEGVRYLLIPEGNILAVME